MKKPRKPSKKALTPAQRSELLAQFNSEALPLELVWNAALEVDRRTNPDHPIVLITEPKWFASCVETGANLLKIARNRADVVSANHKIGSLIEGILERHASVAQFLPIFSAAEKERGRVAFRRGCQLITGLKEPRDAERRFLFALEHIDILKREPFEHYRERGFTLAEVLEGQSALGKIPKNRVRKPYERTGNFRRNKQGRKKIPKK
jgi:hypothetical protein